MLTTAPRRPAVRLPSLPIAARAPAALPVLAITAVGLALRAWAFGRVGGNPFYDAAVRSMGQSWHDFFFGAFEPGARVAIDKAPADLWMQVLSVKLLGFSSVAVRLPELLAGTLAIPLLYDLVRRLSGRPAGLGAAATLALLPTAILTAHSDTMDSVMMALDLLAAWLVVVGAQRRSDALVVAAGAVVGLAFNIKLFEALVIVPALAVLMVLVVDRPAPRRAAVLGGAAVVAAGVSVAWIAAASLTPLPGRPWPIGSTDGSIWSTVFGYDGVDRLSAPASPAALRLDPPGPLRLLQTGGHGYAATIGTTLLAALVVGLLAAATTATARRQRSPMIAGAPPRRARAGAAFFCTWLVLGIALVSHMQRLQPRYLEAVTPAVAGAVGIGVAALAGAPVRHARTLLAAAAAALLAAGALLVHPPAWAIVVGLSGMAGCLAAHRRAGHRRASTAAFTTCALVAILAMPAAGAVAVARAHRSDAGLPSRLPPATIARLSRYLATNTSGAAFELATPTPFRAAPIVVHDGRPVLILTNVGGRPLVTAHQLARLVAGGRVRYALLGRSACATAPPGRCAPAVRWALRHAHDISARAGVPPGTIAELTTRTPPRARRTP